MARTRSAYPPEFRRQMVELVNAGRAPEELARGSEPTAQSIRNWAAQSGRDAGRGDGGLTTSEREELNRLRRESHQPHSILETAYHRADKAIQQIVDLLAA